jgi:hypothetical protein
LLLLHNIRRCVIASTNGGVLCFDLIVLLVVGFHQYVVRVSYYIFTIFFLDSSYMSY